ncbi:MAG: hypothetical protein DRI69_03375 [Bacteroidetes bacterium]|nr:MAG: hypothetical protein DRI69_03375 [Bacteroidota bacterium]
MNVTGSVRAQVSESVIHMDKSFYVSGEIIWYTLHLPEFFNTLDRVVQVQIADDRGNIIEEYKLRTNGKTFVTGYYKVPYDAPTGVYRIFFHGVHQFIGQNIKLAEVEVPVYNDFEKVTAEMTLSHDPVRQASFMTDLSVDISMSGDAVAKELSELNIVIKDASGNPVAAQLSVSVVDAELCGRGVIRPAASVDYRTVEGLHEGMVVKGTLKTKEGGPLQVNVLGLYASDVQRMYYTKSDDFGSFFAKVPYFTGQRQLQFLGYQAEVDDFDVELSYELSPGPIQTQVEYTSEVITYLELSRKRKNIYRYFTTLEHTLDAQPSEELPQELKPGVRFKMQEYELFDNMHSFFGELITALKFDEKDDVFTARLENPRGSAEAETHLSGAPLFIVDGKVTRNGDFIARMDLSLIVYVDLYFDPKMLRKYFNVVGRSGVVIITTRMPDSPFPEEELEDVFVVNGVLAPARFSQPGNAEIPIIAPQLYWDGGLETDYHGTSSVQFMQSDDLSSFRVVVVAQTPDGRRGMGTLEYKLAQ